MSVSTKDFRSQQVVKGGEPIMINIGQVRNATRLNELLKKHGIIFVNNPMGKPIKITFAELS